MHDRCAAHIHLIPEYWQRRQRLAGMLLPGSIAVLPSASTIFMSGVVPYPYRPDPDFTYITGLLQHAVAVLQAGGVATVACASHQHLLLSDPHYPYISS